MNLLAGLGRFQQIQSIYGRPRPLSIPGIYAGWPVLALKRSLFGRYGGGAFSMLRGALEAESSLMCSFSLVDSALVDVMNCSAPVLTT